MRAHSVPGSAARNQNQHARFPRRGKLIARMLPAFTVFCAVLAPTTFAATKTFYKDVLPVVQQRCQSCHRPGEAAPFSMITYGETRPWAKAIKTAVLNKSMPPWSVDPRYGAFKNDCSLSASQIETLVSWVDGGAPQGDPQEAPPPVKFVDGWNIGAPDSVFDMAVPFHLPASGALPYQWIVVPTGFKEDKWVNAVEIRPGNHKVVHHVVLYYRMPGSKWLADVKPGQAVSKPTDGFEGGSADGELGGYTPGMPAIQLGSGRAMLLPRGADLVFELHYTPTGKPETDQTKVGLIFSRQPPIETESKLFVLTKDFVIPPGNPNVRLNAQVTLNAALKLVEFAPHMHLRGKSFELRAVLPDGSSEMLLRVPKYDFDWQLSYRFSSERLLPKGTRLIATGYYDNSANNPKNPNPAAEVRWGDQTWEEMMIGIITVVAPVGADPQTLVEHLPYEGPADPYQIGAGKPLSGGEARK